MVVLILVHNTFISDTDWGNPVCYPFLSVLIIMIQLKEKLFSGILHYFKTMNNVLLDQGLYLPDQNIL